MAVDLSRPSRIHIVGIGGSGMSAIARVLMEMGHNVSGSDAARSLATDRLMALGAVIHCGHDAENLLHDVDLVTASTAIPHDNPELSAARERGLLVLDRAGILVSIAASKNQTIGVAGSHGKSTTSAMLAHILESRDASYIVGADILGTDGGAHWGSSEIFVVEADESDGTFLKLGATHVIVTSIAPDHLEYYGRIDDKETSIDALFGAFGAFVDQADGVKLVCLDDPGAAKLLTGRGLVTYGTQAGADYRFDNVQLGRFESTFSLNHGSDQVDVRLSVAGLHNVSNATAAIAMARELGDTLQEATARLSNFAGVRRRFQRRGEVGGATLVDDYAHLPDEVAAAIAAARAGGWTRVVAVFQPHRYSRTEQVGSDFAGAFDGADLLVLTDVYAAGEPRRVGVDGEVILRAVESARTERTPRTTYVADRSMLASEVMSLIEPGDVVLTLGAGDITNLSAELVGRSGGVTI